jgi:hypothetical protein
MAPRLAVSLGLFLGSMAIGWWLHRRGVMTPTRAAKLVRFIVKGPSPIVLCLSFWRMNLRHVEPWLLPVTGLLVAASTLLPAYWYARQAKLSRSQTGSFLTSAFFSNLGYLGAFTAFALFGEEAYALCVLYFTFFTPSFYTWGFWIGMRYGHAPDSIRQAETYKDDLRLYPFAGMVVGALLSLSGVPRPALLEQLNHALIPFDTALYLVAVGSQLSFTSPRPWLKACLAMSAIKFVYTPLVAWCVASALNITGLARLVILLESSTPVGVSPLVLPLLFGLDRRLTNAVWLFTTAVSIPWLLFIIPVLARL